MAQEPAPGGFKTSKGSTYTLHDDGTTTRNKSDHTDVGHDPGDVGVKERSAKTVYVPDGLAGALSSAGVRGMGPEGARLILHDDGTASLVWKNKDGQWAPSASTKRVPISDKPAVGLQPLEMWARAEDMQGKEAYRRMHAGNKITELTGPEARASAEKRHLHSIYSEGANPADQARRQEKGPQQETPAKSEFSQEVSRLATDLPQTQTSPEARGARLGSEKVFISSLWDAYSKNHPEATREQFNQMLLEANRKGEIQLARADMVEAMHLLDVRESQIKHPSGMGEFHLVRIPEASPFDGMSDADLDIAVRSGRRGAKAEQEQRAQDEPRTAADRIAAMRQRSGMVAAAPKPGGPEAQKPVSEKVDTPPLTKEQIKALKEKLYRLGALKSLMREETPPAPEEVAEAKQSKDWRERVLGYRIDSFRNHIQTALKDPTPENIGRVADAIQTMARMARSRGLKPEVVVHERLPELNEFLGHIARNPDQLPANQEVRDAVRQVEAAAAREGISPADVQRGVEEALRGKAEAAQGTARSPEEVLTPAERMRRGQAVPKAYEGHATEAGIDPRHLHQRAKEIIDLDKQTVAEHNALIKQAWTALNKRGVSQQSFRKFEDSSRVPGLDEVAGEVLRGRRDLVNDAAGEKPVDALFRLLKEGKRDQRTTMSAYEQALNDLQQRAEAQKGDQWEGPGAAEETEVAPGVFFRRNGPTAPPREGTGKVAVGQYGIVQTALELFDLHSYVGRVRENADAAYLTRVQAMEQSGYKAGDIGITMHEIAHHVAKTETLALDPAQMPPKVVAGFRQFDYEPNRSNSKVAMQEGFAEWMRLTSMGELTGLSPEQQAASEYAKRLLSTRVPVAEKLSRVSQMIRQWQDQEPGVRAAGLVSPTGTPAEPNLAASEALAKTVSTTAERLQDFWDDRLAVYTRLEGERKRIGMQASPEGRDLRSVIASTGHMAKHWADEMAGQGMFTFRLNSDGSRTKVRIGKPITYLTEGLSQISPEDLTPQQGERRALGMLPGKPIGASRLGTVLIANHVVNETARGAEMVERGNQMKEQANGKKGATEEAERLIAAGLKKIRTADPEQVRQLKRILDDERAKNPAWFDEAMTVAKRYTELANASREALVSVGFNTPDELQAMKAAYPDYVSLQRVPDEGAFKSDLSKKRHGSGRQFIDPILTLQSRYALVGKQMAKQLSDAALWEGGMHEAGPRGVSSFWKEAVPPTKTKVNVAEIDKALDALGYDQSLRDDLISKLGDKALEYAGQAAPWSETGRNTYTLRYDGKTHTIEIGNKALYQALTAQQGADNNGLTLAKSIARIPGLAQVNNVLKSGATSASMVFSVRNLLRDPWTYFQNAQGPRGFLGNMVRLMAGHNQSLVNGWRQVLGMEPNDPRMKLYQEAAGEDLRAFHFAPRGEGQAGWRMVTGSGKGKEGVIWTVNKVKDVMEAFGFAEHGPRYAEWLSALEERGYSKAKVEAALKANPNESPIPLDVLIYARGRAAEATVDFSRQGVFTHEWNKVAPFFGAHMAAMSQEVRNWAAAAREVRSGMILGPKMKAMGGTMGVALGLQLLHWWWFKDEPWFKELPGHVRDSMWVLGQAKDGSVWGVPKPRGLIGMATTVFEELLRGESGNQRSAGQTGGAILGQALPRGIPVVASEALDVTTNNDWRGKPIVPKRENPDLKDFDQWTKYRLPYLLEQLSGGLASERALRPPWEAFKASGVSPHDSVNRFYTEWEAISKERKDATYNGKAIPQENQQRYSRMSKAHEKLANLNRELRGDAVKKVNQGGRMVEVTVQGTKPTKERSEEIVREQTKIARQALGMD